MSDYGEREVLERECLDDVSEYYDGGDGVVEGVMPCDGFIRGCGLS